MRRMILTILFLVISVGGLVACIDDERQDRLNVQIVKLVDLTEKLKLAQENYADGKLTASEFKELTTDIGSTISEARDEIFKLKEEGVGWWELAGATLLGVVSRGRPTKGLLGIVTRLVTRGKKEEET